MRDGVQLSSTDQITGFVAFMLEDNLRFAYLRKLVLHPLDAHLMRTNAEADLARLLSHPSLTLETLELRCADTYLGYGSRDLVRKAIARLTTTKHLVVLGVSQYSVSSSLIRRLPWDLESISISVTHSYVQQVLPTLAPFSDTLQTVVIASGRYGSALFHDVNPKSCTFPHVQTFGVVYHESVLDVLRSSEFSRTFPAITHLQLFPTDHPTSRQTGPPTDREGQISQPDRMPPSSLSLAECSGALSSVYALHLDCTLSTLRLWQQVRVDDLHLLHTVLEDTRPRRLCLSIELGDAESLFTTLRTVNVCPARVDLKIFVLDKSVVCSLFPCLSIISTLSGLTSAAV